MAWPPPPSVFATAAANAARQPCTFGELYKEYQKACASQKIKKLPEQEVIPLCRNLEAAAVFRIEKAGKQARGKDPDLQVTLLTRSAMLLPQHSAGVRAIFTRLCAERQLSVRLGCAVDHATEAALHCTDGSVVPYDEAIWCTQGGAPPWLASGVLQLGARTCEQL